MIHVDYTTIRDVQRNYKKISEVVNKENLSFVVMSNNRPQFVIVGLKAFSEMQTLPGTDAGASLLNLIDWAEKKTLTYPLI